MATVNAADISVALDGKIRWTGGVATTYTVLELHRFLQLKASEGQASGDDFMDITFASPSDKKTDNILTLQGIYNIDQVLSEHLYDGSVKQGAGGTEETYSGIEVVGTVPAGTILDIIQDNKVLRNFWGTGLNGAGNTIMKIMIRTQAAGADIDGKRLRVQARKLGSKFAEFSVTAGLGNATAAILIGGDLNNATVEATIAGWSSIVNIAEGLNLIDVDNNTVNEEYYSQWDLGTQTINNLYERLKWLQRSATTEDSNADIGSTFTVDNATLLGVAQSFANGTLAKRATKARVRLRKSGLPTGPISIEIRAHSGAFGTASIPTGTALATSETFEAADLTTTYAEVEFRFLTQFEMVASTNYELVVLHPTGTAGAFVQVEGKAVGTHAGNRSSLTVATWTAAAAEDLWFEIYSSPTLYGMSGELFRGITHQVAYTGEVGGPWTQNEVLSWGTGLTAGTGALLAVGDDGVTGDFYIQLLTGVVPAANTITGGTSGATATASTVTARTVSAEFVGATTGSSIIGAYGVGLQAADLTASDQVFDLTNTKITPPNNVTHNTTGVVVGEDYVLVGPEVANDFQRNQMALSGALTGAAVTSIVMAAPIPADTPSSGTIRVVLDSGVNKRVVYSSYTGSTFTIPSTDFSGVNQAANANNAWVSYVDKLATATTESFTTVFDATRSLFIRVRDGGATPIKPFATTSSLGAAGGSATVNRTSDL